MYEHFDFIEVGTSDFRTLTQYVKESDISCPFGCALRNWDPNNVRGIAVEPVEHLLKRLPALPNVMKVNVALGSEDSNCICTSVHEDAGIEYPYSYAVWLARGTATVSSVRKTHPFLEQCLQNEGISSREVLVSTCVPVWTFETLAKRYRIASVDLLKLDCEGADLDILRSVVAYCDKYSCTFPRIIAFETNRLTSTPDVDKVLDSLCERGYRILSRGNDTVLKRVSKESWIHCCDFLYGTCTRGDSCFFDHDYTLPACGSPTVDTRMCCFGQQCSRGHGGTTPKCIVCGSIVKTNRCYCTRCWKYRMRMRYEINQRPHDEQSAYWNA